MAPTISSLRKDIVHRAPSPRPLYQSTISLFEKMDESVANEKKQPEEKMKLNLRKAKFATTLLSVLLTGVLLTSCSQTSSPAPSQAAQAPAAQAAPPPMAS